MAAQNFTFTLSRIYVEALAEDLLDGTFLVAAAFLAAGAFLVAAALALAGALVPVIAYEYMYICMC